MDLENLYRKVIAVARVQAPSERVPYGFEQRIMAQLKRCSVPDEWALWARVLWRAAVPSVAVMLLLIAWSVSAPVGNRPANDLALDLENTLLTAADQEPSPPPEFFW
jgi:hypothetical protein